MSKDLSVAQPHTTVEEVARMMRGEDAGSIPVVRKEELVGIVTDRDLAIRVIAEGRDPKSVHVEEVMTPHPTTIGPEDDSDAALRIMNDQQVRRLPVTEGRRLVGLVTMGKLAQKGESSHQVGQAEMGIIRGA